MDDQREIVELVPFGISEMVPLLPEAQAAEEQGGTTNYTRTGGALVENE